MQKRFLGASDGPFLPSDYYMHKCFMQHILQSIIKLKINLSGRRKNIATCMWALESLHYIQLHFFLLVCFRVCAGRVRAIITQILLFTLQQE